MATEKVTKTKFKISYEDKGGSYTYSNLKESAANEDVYLTAEGFARLQSKSAESYFKIVDSILE